MTIEFDFGWMTAEEREALLKVVKRDLEMRALEECNISELKRQAKDFYKRKEILLKDFKYNNINEKNQSDNKEDNNKVNEDLIMSINRKLEIISEKIKKFLEDILHRNQNNKNKINNLPNINNEDTNSIESKDLKNTRLQCNGRCIRCKGDNQMRCRTCGYYFCDNCLVARGRLLKKCEESDVDQKSLSCIFCSLTREAEQRMWWWNNASTSHLMLVSLLSLKTPAKLSNQGDEDDEAKTKDKKYECGDDNDDYVKLNDDESHDNEDEGINSGSEDLSIKKLHNKNNEENHNNNNNNNKTSENNGVNAAQENEKDNNSNKKNRNIKNNNNNDEELYSGVQNLHQQYLITTSFITTQTLKMMELHSQLTDLDESIDSICARVDQANNNNNNKIDSSDNDTLIPSYDDEEYEISDDDMEKIYTDNKKDLIGECGDLEGGYGDWDGGCGEVDDSNDENYDISGKDFNLVYQHNLHFLGNKTIKKGLKNDNKNKTKKFIEKVEAMVKDGDADTSHEIRRLLNQVIQPLPTVDDIMNSNKDLFIETS